MSSFATARTIALALPETEEGSAYGTPAFRVRGRLFARLRDDGSLAVRVDRGFRDALVEAGPEAFFVTPHYRDYPWVLVRLEAIGAEELDDLLADAWALVAPKRLAATLLAASA